MIGALRHPRQRLPAMLYGASCLMLLAAAAMPLVESGAGDSGPGGRPTEESQFELSRSLVAVDAALARPIFHAGRAPYVPPPVVAAPAPVAAPLGLELAGIAGSGNTRWAYIINPATGETIRAETGDEVDGWTITSIGPDAVDFRRGTEENRLETAKKTGPIQRNQARRPRN